MPNLIQINLKTNINRNKKEKKKHNAKMDDIPHHSKIFKRIYNWDF